MMSSTTLGCISSHQLTAIHGPLTRYIKLRIAHALGMSETFSPPPTPKQTASYRSRHVSRHVCDARAVMHDDDDDDDDDGYGDDDDDNDDDDDGDDYDYGDIW